MQGSILSIRESLLAFVAFCAVPDFVKSVAMEFPSGMARGFDLNRYGFGEAAYEQGKYFVNSTPKTLPLLWDENQQPNEEDDQTDDLDETSSTSNNYGEEDGAEGWPPINSRRGKLSTFVKVKMEGVLIARKVDLSLYNSYQELKYTLVHMFGRSGAAGEENVEAYDLTYQDGEGDWLLAGDVPWSSFIQSAEQIKLIRSVE